MEIPARFLHDLGPALLDRASRASVRLERVEDRPEGVVTDIGWRVWNDEPRRDRPELLVEVHSRGRTQHEHCGEGYVKPVDSRAVLLIRAFRRRIGNAPSEVPREDDAAVLNEEAGQPVQLVVRPLCL